MRIQIVNQHDEIIGLKERETIDFTQDIYRVSALWIQNTKGESLIAKRAMTKKNSPGRWGPAVAGTVEANETYESNIIKEAEEEIGLRGVSFQQATKVRVTEPNPIRQYFVQWFIATVDWPIETFTRQVEEVDELRWINTQELIKDVAENPESYLPHMQQDFIDLKLV